MDRFPERIVKIDASGTLDDVFQRTMKIVLERLEQKPV
jgi:dTMP kinase